MRSIDWAYKWVNVRIQARDLANNPANLILSGLGVASIVVVAFLFGYSARMPAWGADVVPAILGKKSGLSLLLLAYCGFFGVVTFVLTLIALFYPTQVQELDRLRALPIPESTLFGFKCGDVLHSMTPLVFLVVLAAGAGLNLGGQASAGFVATLLVLSVLLVYIVGWLMMAGVLAGVTVLPRAAFGRGALLLVVLALGATGLVAFRAVDRRHALETLSGVGPTAWTADLILASQRGDWAQAAKSGALVLAVALALRTLASLAYTRLYLRRLSTLLEKLWPDPRAAARRGSWLEAILLAPLARASTATRAIARKDLRWIARDPIVGYATYAAVAFVFLGAGLAWWEGTHGEAEEGVAYPLWALVTMVALGHLLNLNLSAFGREERCLEALSATPITPRELLAAKFHVSFVLSLPVLALGIVAFASRAPHLAPAMWGLVGAIGVAGAAAFAWVSVTLGAIFPKYDAKNQFRAVTLVGVGVHVTLLGLLVASMVGSVVAVRGYGARFVFVPALVGMMWAGVMAFLTVEAKGALHAMLGTREKSGRPQGPPLHSGEAR